MSNPDDPNRKPPGGPPPQYPPPQQGYPPQQYPPAQQGYPPQQYQPPPGQYPQPWVPPPLQPEHSGLAIAAFVLAIVLFVFSFLPFLGMVALIPVILAVVDLQPAPPHLPRKKGLAKAALIIGGIDSLIAVVSLVSCLNSPQHSCPHVYAYDGKTWTLDSDPLGGAIVEGAERRDTDRLAHLRPIDGTYRIRIVDELQETDRIDDVALLVVDHAPGTSVLATPKGELLELRDELAALSATDTHGRDLRAPLHDADGAMVSGLAADFPDDAVEPRERITLVFARPAAGRLALVLRARTSAFAESSLERYLGRMGSAMPALLAWTQDSKSYAFADRMTDELRRLGLPLIVQVGSGDQWTKAAEIGPIGPALPRDFVVPIDVPAGATETISVRLELTPMFWDLDRITLATAAATSGTRLTPRTAIDGAGHDVLELLRLTDGRRLELHTGDLVEVVFDAPAPAPDRERTVLLDLRGFYEAVRRPGLSLDALKILEHRLGWDSLPRFALREARAR